jgi:hypothetical protein
MKMAKAETTTAEAAGTVTVTLTEGDLKIVKDGIRALVDNTTYVMNSIPNLEDRRGGQELLDQCARVQEILRGA